MGFVVIWGLYLCRSITNNSGIGSRQYMSDFSIFIRNRDYMMASI